MFSTLLLSDSVSVERFSVLPFFIMAQFADVRHRRRFIVGQFCKWRDYFLLCT